MNALSGHSAMRKMRFLLRRVLRAVAPKDPLRVFCLPGSSRQDQIEAVYVINLDRQQTRWKIVQGEVRRQVMEGGDRLLSHCHRITAIDGKLLDLSSAIESVSFTYPLAAQYFVDPDPRLLTLIREKDVRLIMSREEVAVALSHIKAWHRVVTEKRSHVLILEDDVFFESHFATQLNRSWEELPRTETNAPAFDLLYLSFREVDRGAHWVECSPNIRRLVRGYWWLSGYVLSNAGARKLLDRLPVVGPVDLWINHVCSDLEVYSSPRSVIVQRTDLQSDNRYSILPLLSQIGIQTDETHLVLEQTRGRRPVFCVGYGREASGVLESALGLLSYRCCNDRWGRFTASVGQLLDEDMPLLFDAYIRVESVSKQVGRIQVLYPDAVFIFPSAAHRDSELSMDEFRTLTTQLRGRDDRTLRFDVHDEADWLPLCRFLRCDTPGYPFPTNRHEVEPANASDGPGRFMPIAVRESNVLEHDVHPWIVPYKRMSAFGVLSGPRTHGAHIGAFRCVSTDVFSSFETSRWTVLEESFPSNLAVFRQENVSIFSEHGCRLTLDRNGTGDRAFGAASVRSRKSYRYGRFAVNLKPARASGVVTAVFLHRSDPWQEIDIEFLGEDTTRLLTNVYFNPGDAGTVCNFGNRGTPVTIDLAFDAAEDYHKYAIEWEPHEMRWFVDDQLVHVRGAWEPTPIPNLPMGLYCSIWPPRSIELAGALDSSKLPVSSEVKQIQTWEWCKVSSKSAEIKTERNAESCGCEHGTNTAQGQIQEDNAVLFEHTMRTKRGHPGMY